MSTAAADPPQLTGRQVVLQPWTRQVVTALLGGTDPGFAVVTGYPAAGSLDGLRAWRLGPGHGAGFGWSVVLAEQGVVGGDCWTKGWVDAAGLVEIAYAVAPGARRRGHGTDAVRTLTGWLAGQPDVRGVLAEVEAGNDASRRLLERVGFTVSHEVGGRIWFSLPSAG